MTLQNIAVRFLLYVENNFALRADEMMRNDLFCISHTEGLNRVSWIVHQFNDGAFFYSFCDLHIAEVGYFWLNK